VLYVAIGAAWQQLDFGCCIVVFIRLPTDVQAEAIPLILGGGDVLMVG